MLPALLVILLASSACQKLAEAESLLMSGFDDVTIPASGLLFYYRHPEEGLWMKRVVWLPDESVVAFFRRAWREGARSVNPQLWLEAQLGGPVYGLCRSLAQAMASEDVGPLGFDALDFRGILTEHLGVEGMVDLEDPSGPVQLDAQTLRVQTDDDEYELAYGFVPVALIRSQPERFAFLAYDRAELPAEYAAQPDFRAIVAVPELLPAGSKMGCTYVVAIAISDTGWLSDIAGTMTQRANPASRAFPGVRVPDLVQHLREVEPVHDRRPVLEGLEPGLRVFEAVGKTELANRMRAEYANKTEIITWPYQWLTMRASITSNAVSLETVLQRWQRYWGVPYFHCTDTQVSQAEAHRAFVAQESRWSYEPPEHAELVVDAGPHHAVMHRLDETWVVFDDLWATEHPGLANSLLVWGLGWDPVRSGK